MNAHETKTFMSGDSIALRLPKNLAIDPDERMTIEQNGDVLTIRRVHDPAEAKRKLAALIADLQAIGQPGEIKVREPIEFPTGRGSNESIAATAHTHGLTLVTTNGADLADVPGLDLEVWPAA